MKKYLTISFIITLLLTSYSYGQNDWDEQQGEIEDAEVVIEKDVKITLPYSNRIFNKIPPISLGNLPGQNRYDKRYFDPPSYVLASRMRVLTIAEESLTKTYSNYVKGGLGSSVSPFLIARFSNSRSQNYGYGLNLAHWSSGHGPIDKKNSANGLSQVGLHGKFFNDQTTLAGNINYERSNQYFYGYNPGIIVERDSIQQIFNRLNVSLSLENIDPEDYFNYDLDLSFNYMNDNFEALENEFAVNWQSAFRAAGSSRILIDADIFLISRSDNLISSLNRHLIVAMPAYEFTFANIRIRAGVNLTLENDNAPNLDKFHVFPDVEANYKISEGLNVYGGLAGKVEKKTLNNITEQNPFLAPDISIFNANNQIEIYGGSKGKLGNFAAYDFGFSYASIENMGFFLNDTSDFSRFTIAYDTASSDLLTVQGELSYAKENLWSWTLTAKYNLYNTEIQPEAWHMPDFEFKMLGTYNLYNKIILGTDLVFLSGMKAIDQGSNAVSLDPIIDLGISIEYKLSSQFSAFLIANNLISSEYERYHRYPVRGLQISGALSYSF